MTWDYIGAPWFQPALVVLHVLLVVLLAALLRGWWRDAPALRPWIGATLGFAALWLLLVPRTALEPLVDPAWFQPLQESDAAGLWAELLGSRGHIGPGWSRWLAYLLPMGPAVPVRWMAFQLWFVPPLLALHALAVRAIARSSFAALTLTLALVATPAVRLAVLSDQFVVAPSLYLVAGALPVAVAGDGTAPRGRRLLALLTLLVLAPLLLTYRIESAGLPLAAAVGAAIALVVPLAWRQGVADVVRGALATWSGRAIGLLALAVWVAAAWRFGAVTAPWQLAQVQQWAWLIVAVWPLNPAWTLLPLFLVAMQTVGVALLTMIGLGRAVVVAPLRTGLVGLGAVVLVQAYVASAHGMVPALQGLEIAWWEMYRYLFNLQVVWTLLAAFAWPVVVGHRRGRAVAALLLCTLAQPLGWPSSIRLLPDEPGQRVPRTADADHDPQRFYRWFAPRLAAEPDCLWVTQTRRWGGIDAATTEAERLAWVVMVPDPNKGHELVTAPIALSPREAALQVRPDATCAYLVASPDCSLAAETRCLSDAAELVEVERTTFRHRPFVHPQHGYFYRDEIVVGRWRLLP